MDAWFTVVIPTRDSAAWIGTLLDHYRARGVTPTLFLDSRTRDETRAIAQRAGAPIVDIAPFAFVEFDPKRGYGGQFVPVTDENKILEIGKKISPVNHVSKDSAPSLIIHGDKDFLVPIQQAEIMVAKLKDAGVAAELVVREGQAHGWADTAKDMQRIGDWLDKHLKKKG